MKKHSVRFIRVLIVVSLRTCIEISEDSSRTLRIMIDISVILKRVTIEVPMRYIYINDRDSSRGWRWSSIGCHLKKFWVRLPLKGVELNRGSIYKDFLP